jgi:predicted nucleic acid-binding protein
MARFTAILDANILYSMTITDIALEVAHVDVYRAIWSDAIHDEWVRNLKVKRPDLDPAKIERRRAAMDLAVADAKVTGYEPLIDALTLPDKNDRHVLAAAIAGNADVIVTLNLKDFPDEAVAPYGIEVQHPDTFLIHQRGLNQQQFLECIRRVRRRMKNPEVSRDAYLESLKKAELVVLAAELAKAKSLL